MPEHQGREVVVEMRTDASAEQIWNAWADPAKISQWFVDRAEGFAHKGAEVTWMFDEFGYRLPYQVMESIPGERLMLGGQIPGRIPFLLEVTLHREAGETVVRLVNSGFLEGGSFDEEYEGVLSGWQLALTMLKYYAEHHYGQPKQQYLLMRDAEVDLETLTDWYTKPERLNQWLTRSASIGKQAGDSVTLELRDGTRIEGTLAVVSRREVAIIWSEANAMVELKGWGAGAKKIVAIRVTSWDSDAGTAIRPALEEAIESFPGTIVATRL